MTDSIPADQWVKDAESVIFYLLHALKPEDIDPGIWRMMNRLINTIPGKTP